MDRLNLIATPWQQRFQEATHNLGGVSRAFAAAMVVSLGPGIEAAEDVVRFRGDAYDLATGKFVYSENHSEYRKAGVHVYSRVSYRDRSGKEFANKLITFQGNKMQPTYELRDARDG